MTPKPHRRRTIGITETASRELLSAAMAFKHRAGITRDAIDMVNDVLDEAVKDALVRLDRACQVAVHVVCVGDKVRVTPPVDGLPSSMGEVVAFVRDGWVAVRFVGEPAPIHLPVGMIEVVP